MIVSKSTTTTTTLLIVRGDGGGGGRWRKAHQQPKLRRVERDSSLDR